MFTKTRLALLAVTSLLMLTACKERPKTEEATIDSAAAAAAQADSATTAEPVSVSAKK